MGLLPKSAGRSLLLLSTLVKPSEAEVRVRVAVAPPVTLARLAMERLPLRLPDAVRPLSWMTVE